MQPRPLGISCLAELLGTFLLIFFGCGAVHVAVLLGDLIGLWQVGIVWGVAIMLAVYVCGPISGAHINPAITLGLAAWGLFPKARALPYIASQLAGAMLAALVLFTLFDPFLARLEHNKGVTRGEPGSEITAMCYGEYFPNPGSLAGGEGVYDAERHASLNALVGVPAACLAEVLGTAILALVVLAVTEPAHTQGPRNLAPVFIGLTVSVLITVIAPLTQACFNPARDFGPRIFAYFAGWGDVALPGPRGMGIVWVYLVAPIVGGVLGMGLYQLVLRQYVHEPGEPEKGTTYEG